MNKSHYVVLTLLILAFFAGLYLITSAKPSDVSSVGFDEVIVERTCEFLELEGTIYQRCHDGTMWIVERMDDDYPFQGSQPE